MAKSKTPAQPEGVVGTDTGNAPIISFDRSPVLGFYDGSVRIALLAVRSVPAGSGKVTDDFVVTGYLRCGVGAARELRNVLDQAILLATPTETESQ